MNVQSHIFLNSSSSISLDIYSIRPLGGIPIISPLFTPSVIQYPITFSFQYAFSLHIIHTATGLNIFDSINTSKDCIGSQIEEFSTSLLFFSSVFPLSPLPQINSSVCDSVTLFSESCNS